MLAVANDRRRTALRWETDMPIADSAIEDLRAREARRGASVLGPRADRD